jgi:hypothetical protein
LARRGFLSKRLHRHDPSGVDGPDPSHGHVEVSFSQPAGAQEPSEHQHAITVILQALRHRLKAAVGDPNVPKPEAKLPTPDRGPLSFEKPEHRRPPDLWVDERQQLLHVALLPSAIDASNQLNALRSHPAQCPASEALVRVSLAVRWQPGGDQRAAV